MGPQLGLCGVFTGSLGAFIAARPGSVSTCRRDSSLEFKLREEVSHRAARSTGEGERRSPSQLRQEHSLAIWHTTAAHSD